MTRTIGKHRSIRAMDNMMEDNHTIMAVATPAVITRNPVACTTEIKNMMIEVAITHSIQFTIVDPWISTREETIKEEVEAEVTEANVEEPVLSIIKRIEVLQIQLEHTQLDPMCRWTNLFRCSNTTTTIRITIGIKREVSFSHNQETRICPSKVSQSTQFIEGNLGQTTTVIQTIMEDHQIKIKTKIEESRSHQNHSIRDWRKSIMCIKMKVNTRLSTDLVEEVEANTINRTMGVRVEDLGSNKMTITNIKITITKNSRKCRILVPSSITSGPELL